MGRRRGDRRDWATLVGDIVSGASYHAPLVSLAARLVGSKMHDGSAVKLLRAIMAASTAPHDARWQSRFDRIPRIVVSARDKFTKPSSLRRPGRASRSSGPTRGRPLQISPVAAGCTQGITFAVKSS